MTRTSVVQRHRQGEFKGCSRGHGDLRDGGEQAARVVKDNKKNSTLEDKDERRQNFLIKYQPKSSRLIFSKYYQS